MAEPKHPNGLVVVHAPTVLLSLIRVGTLANTEEIGSRCRPIVQRKSSEFIFLADQVHGVDGKGNCDSRGGICGWHLYCECRIVDVTVDLI